MGGSGRTPAGQSRRSRSKGTWRRGKLSSPPVLAPQVAARVSASAASSSSSWTARSRIRRGSTRTTCAPAGSRSGSTVLVVEDDGSHDSMPSNCSPSARRSRLRRPPGPAAHRAPAAARTLRRWDELPAPEEDDGVEVGRRSLVADGERGQAVDLVAPQVDAHRHVGGGREHVDDAAPHGELAAVLDLVLAAVARARPGGPAARRASSCCRGGPSIGAVPSERARAAGGGPASAPRSPAAARERRVRPGLRSSVPQQGQAPPIVSTSGLTRSKGSVSHAGSTATGAARRAPTTSSRPPSPPASGDRRQARSSASRSASSPGRGHDEQRRPAR